MTCDVMLSVNDVIMQLSKSSSINALFNANSTERI